MSSSWILRVVVPPLLTAVALAATAHADSIAIQGGTQTVTAFNARSTLDSQSHTVPTGPISSWTQTTLAADVGEGAFYASSGTLDTDLGQGSFALDMALHGFHYKGETGYGYTQAFGQLYFTANEAVTYTLSGALTRTAGSGLLQQRVFLVEDGTANYLFDSGALSSSSATSLAGSGLTGTLAAGTTYELYFEYFIGTNAYNGSVTGTGGLQLAFTGTSPPVPEPGTLALLGLGLAGLAAGRRRRSDPPRRSNHR